MTRETRFVRRAIQSTGRGTAKLRKKYTKASNVLDNKRGNKEWL